MLSRTLRISSRKVWQPVHRAVQFRRSYNGPHTTYFQPPPPQKRSWGRRIFTTFIAYSAGAASLYLFLVNSTLLEELAEELEFVPEEAIKANFQIAAALEVPPMTVEAATATLKARSDFGVGLGTVSHFTQLPSNLPCEDSYFAGAFHSYQDPARIWGQWGICDGHAGPRTAQLLRSHLPVVIGRYIAQAGCMDRSYIPNDADTISAIRRAFIDLDRDILESAAKGIEAGGSLAELVAAGAMAFSGSCALLALYDPAQSVLRVANVGDSRAVLGRWDNETKKYVAKPMSIDQTGFNPDEVARLRKDHPDEDVVDHTTGRVHGIAVSRAFGDSRWKWTESLSRQARDKIWGPPPRPQGLIKTPPYLTAEPEIMETQIHCGERPDFLIMGSDGLWDNISSQDAVTCVQMWLDKYDPLQTAHEQHTDSLDSSLSGWRAQSDIPGSRPDPPTAFDTSGNEGDVYYDENEKCLKWRVSPKHFVVEDFHAGVHLVKNALGGNRRNLFTGLMTVQPPLSRNVRDDITAQVIFFGVDTELFEKQQSTKAASSHQ